MVDRIPADAIGMTLAHHGLVVWGDDAEQAHARLVEVVARIEEYIAACRRGRLLLGAVRDRRRRRPRSAAGWRSMVLPAVRGAASGARWALRTG